MHQSNQILHENLAEVPKLIPNRYQRNLKFFPGLPSLEAVLRAQGNRMNNGLTRPKKSSQNGVNRGGTPMFRDRVKRIS